MRPPATRRAVFLDRDGTLIADLGYPRDPAGVCLLPGAGEALARLRREGFLLILVSNQSGVGRGLIHPAELEAVHRRLEECLAAFDVRLTAAYYCLHAPEAACDCRKPAPGLLLRAAREHALELARCVLVGDKPSDVAAGQRAGCRTILLRSHPLAAGPEPAPDLVAAEWCEIPHKIVQTMRSPD
jgi:histidinol-phosphate phosphatase family protein